VSSVILHKGGGEKRKELAGVTLQQLENLGTVFRWLSSSREKKKTCYCKGKGWRSGGVG